MMAPKKSIAIALSVQKQAKKKKMAAGGEVRAGASKPSADDKDKREMDMLDGHPTRHAEELEATEEHMSGADESDERELEMMARGGEVDARKEKMTTIDDAMTDRDELMLDGHPTRHMDEINAKSERMASADDSDDRELGMLRHYAMGGIVDAIMKKRRGTSMDDSTADVQYSNGDEHLNLEDELSYEAGRSKTYYDDSQMKPQPKSSNLKGHALSDEDSHDMVDSIRKKYSTRR